MATSIHSMRTQLNILKSSTSGAKLSKVLNQARKNQSILNIVEQVRFKSSTRQTGGGKGKSTKTNENRAAQTKGYLKKPKSNNASTDGKTDRFDTIRQILYDQDPSLTDDARFKKLQAIIPEIEIHETIDRAWKLHERYQREKQAEELEKQYQSINRALEELRISDLKLYLKVIKDENGSTFRLQNILQKDTITNTTNNDDSNSKINLNSTGKLFGLFPRQIKLPTETLPNLDKIWDLHWKNPVDPLS